MKKILFGALSLLAVIGLVGCANPNAVTKEEMKTIKFLTGDEVKQLLTGSNIVGTSFRHKAEFDLTFHADGKVSGLVGTEKLKFDGKWYVRDQNVRCVESFISKNVFCRRIYKDQDKYHEISEDNIRTATFIVK